MSKITSLRSCTVRVPLNQPTALATRNILARDYTLVEVTTDGGCTGIGFCYCGSTVGTLTTLAVRDMFAPLLLGQDTHRVEGLWQDLYHEALLHGRTGTVMRALSAIDIALWDRNARAGIKIKGSESLK